MVEPRLLIDALSHLREDRKILCFEVELIARAAKIKASFAYITLGVFAYVSPSLRGAGFGCDYKHLVRLRTSSNDYLVIFALIIYPIFFDIGQLDIRIK